MKLLEDPERGIAAGAWCGVKGDLKMVGHGYADQFDGYPVHFADLDRTLQRQHDPGNLPDGDQIDVIVLGILHMDGAVVQPRHAPSVYRLPRRFEQGVDDVVEGGHVPTVPCCRQLLSGHRPRIRTWITAVLPSNTSPLTELAAAPIDW